MTDVQLQKIIDKSENKWASYRDMREVPESLIDACLEAAGEICYDAVNLDFHYGSSTSGMYPYWNIKISPMCTVYIQRSLNFHGATGKTLSAALADFTLKLRKLTKDRLEKGDPNE